MTLAMQNEPTDLKCFLVFFSPWVLESWRTLMIAVMTCYDILGIASMNTQKGFMLSFLRVVLIVAAFISVGATTRGWHSDSDFW